MIVVHRKANLRPLNVVAEAVLSVPEMIMAVFEAIQKTKVAFMQMKMILILMFLNLVSYYTW
jgi:hypothetical protein